MNEGSKFSGKSRKDKRKAIKKSTVDISSVPPIGSLPGNIDPLQFAKARTSEVLLLKKEIEDAKHRGARRVFQTLPRSMRRRAASYNIRRLPVRLRMKALEEAAKDPETAHKMIKKPPCRRRRRRPSNIQQESTRRQQNKLWLETHMWHCKRAKMVDLWGYRVALNANEKVLKSCTRNSVSGCFLYDASYHEVIICKSDPLLNSFLHPRGGYWHQSYNFLDQKGVLIGPVSVLKEVCQVVLIVHPLISSTISSILENTDLLLRGPIKGTYNIFNLEGAKAKHVLESVLEARIDFPADNPVLRLNTKDPRFSFPSLTRKGSKSNTPPAQYLEQYPDFWNPESQEDRLRFRKSQHDINTLRSQLLIPGSKLDPTDEDPFMPVFLLGDSERPTVFPGLTLIVPKGWGRPLWQSLVFMKGVRFGGLKEYNHVQLEHRRKVFPQDYAPSEAWGSFVKEKATELQATWDRRPPSKRVNFKKLGITSPFLPDLSLPVTGQFWMESTGKGVPDYSAIVSSKEGIILGFVTSCCYSQLQGRGVAMASLNLPVESLMLPLDVDFQNANGTVRRPARITCPID